MIDLVVQSQDKDLLKPLTTYELKEDKKTLIKVRIFLTFQQRLYVVLYSSSFETSLFTNSFKFYSLMIRFYMYYKLCFR